MSDRTGQQFGNYRLVRLLGRGGFAEVYLGEHIHIQRRVAIKVLSDQLSSTDLEHFIREAQTITALEHPHIVRVFDFGIQENVPFLVMDYAPNGTLRGRHPRGSRMSLDNVLSYIRQIAPALQHAHDQCIIHRDVKPENMLLGSHGEILLSDFGIAVTTATTTSHQRKTTAGTVAYMAPEQIMGKPCIASDQYALAVIVYEWLTGEEPFHGSLFEMYGQHLNAPIPSLRKINPDIPPQVEQCIAKALAKKPDERFASIQNFATALQESCQANAFTSAATEPIAPGTPAAANIGQNDPTFVKPLPKMPASRELGPDDLTYLLPSGVPALSNAAQADMALLKMKVEGTHLPNTNQDESIQNAAAPVVPMTPSFTPILPLPNIPNQVQPPTRPRRRIKTLPVMAACSVLVVLLGVMSFLPFFGGGGAYSFTFHPTITSTPQQHSTPTPGQSNQPPTPTPTPGQPDSQSTSTSSTGQPNLSPPSPPPPVQRTLSATQPQSSTVNATGQGQTPAQYATGYLLFSWGPDNANRGVGEQYSAETKFVDPHHTPSWSVVIDESVSLGLSKRTQQVRAHFSVAGAVGNIGAGQFNPGSSTPKDLVIYNPNAFTGGTDVQQYTFVQQSDIDNASAPLKTSTMQGAKTSILQQLHSGEHLVNGDIQCSPSTVTSDHNVGDRVNKVTVTVTTLCTATAST